jgi:hypothetical protein
MPYNTYPFTWFKSSYKRVPEQTFSGTSKYFNPNYPIELTGVLNANIFKPDDQIFFTTTNTYVTANVPYYIKLVTTTGGNTQIYVTAQPTYIYPQSPIIQVAAINTSTAFKIPGYVKFDLPLTGVTGQVPALDVSVENAEATTGDVRYVIYAISKLLMSLWSAKPAGEKTSTMVLSTSESMTEPGTVINSYSINYTLSYVPAGLKPEAV